MGIDPSARSPENAEQTPREENVVVSAEVVPDAPSDSTISSAKQFHFILIGAGVMLLITLAISGLLALSRQYYFLPIFAAVELILPLSVLVGYVWKFGQYESQIKNIIIFILLGILCYVVIDILLFAFYLFLIVGGLFFIGYGTALIGWLLSAVTSLQNQLILLILLVLLVLLIFLVLFAATASFFWILVLYVACLYTHKIPRLTLTGAVAYGLCLGLGYCYTDMVVTLLFFNSNYWEGEAANGLYLSLMVPLLMSLVRGISAVITICAIAIMTRSAAKKEKIAILKGWGIIMVKVFIERVVPLVLLLALSSGFSPSFVNDMVVNFFSLESRLLQLYSEGVLCFIMLGYAGALLFLLWSLQQENASAPAPSVRTEEIDIEANAGNTNSGPPLKVVMEDVTIDNGLQILDQDDASEFDL